MIGSITEEYKSTDDFCVDLEQDFGGFKAFAEGNLIFTPPYKVHDFCLSRSLWRKLNFIATPPRSRCDLKTL